MEIVNRDEVHPKIIEALLKTDTGLLLDDALENEMILNMGPQHPATHGVLRLVLRLDGETVIGCVPELGYLHRGYEKMAENMSYYEFIPQSHGMTIAQDEKSCVVFGMPNVAIEMNVVDKVLPLESIAEEIVLMVS